MQAVNTQLPKPLNPYAYFNDFLKSIVWIFIWNKKP